MGNKPMFWVEWYVMFEGLKLYNVRRQVSDVTFINGVLTLHFDNGVSKWSRDVVPFGRLIKYKVWEDIGD